MKLITAFALLFLAPAAMADDAKTDGGPVYGPQLEGYTYPFPVQHYRFQSQGVAMDMAYMDVPPATPTGATSNGSMRLSCCMARISAPPPGKAASGR